MKLPENDPTEDYQLKFKHDTSTNQIWQMPSGITITVDWGDGSSLETIQSPLALGWAVPHL